MWNEIEINDENIDVTKDSNATNFNVTNTHNYFSSNLMNILTNPDNKKLTTYLEKVIKLHLCNIKQINTSTILNKYFEENWKLNIENFNKKINKYLPIHLPILTDYLEWWLFALKYISNLSSQDLLEKQKKLINDFFKKYILILYIFWEKINLIELEKNLKLELTEIEFLYEKVSENIEIIETIENKQIKKLQKESKLTKKNNSTSEKEDNTFLSDPFCATTYRNAFKKVMSEWKNITPISRLSAVWEEIEKLYKLEFRELFTVFKKWYDSEWNFWDNMFYLEDTIKKILWSIIIFKDSGITFTESFSSNIRQKKFLKDINKELIEWNINIWNRNKKTTIILLELFKEFIEISVNNIAIGDFLDFVNKLNELKRETAESKIPTSLKCIHNINAKNIDFDDWSHIHEFQKYELMFSNIISNNWILTLSEHLELDNINPDLIKLFTESYWIDYNIVLAQFQEIKWLAKSWITIKEFVENDINNLNLLIIWWRFLLKLRKLTKEWKNKITKKDIKKIEEKPYWIVEIISEHLKEKWILESNKLEFKPHWKLNNISVQTIPEQLKSIFKWFKSWPIDLKESKINTWEIDVLIKDITDFYIPSQLSEKEEFTNIDLEIDLINNWLNTWIDLCYNLVKNKPITNNDQKKYLKLLEKNKIVPDNLKDLNIENKDNIKNLVETLKYIKGQRYNLKDMMQIGNKDKNKLITILWPLLNETKDKMAKDCFWPDKSFIRAFTKLIKLYAWDFTQFWDLTRLRVVEDNISNMVNSIVDFISFAVWSEEITHISIVDNIWEPISDPRKKSWYRDIKLFLNLKGWNVVEVQFQYKEMLEVKEKWIELANWKNSKIFEKLKKEEKLFTIEEMRDFLTFAIKKNIELPTIDILNNLLRDWNVYWLINELEIENDQLALEKISTNYTYNIIRQLPEDSNIEAKIVKLERIISDYTWAWAVLKYLISKWVKIK